MSTSFEVFDHEIGDFILFSISFVRVRSIPLFFFSKTQEWPVSSRKPLCEVSYILGIRIMVWRIIPSLSNQYRWISTWRGVFLQIVVALFFERSDRLGPFEESPVMYALVNYCTQTELVLHWCQIILWQRLMEGFKLTFPFRIRWWMIIHPSQTWNWTWVDVSFCCCPHDYLVVTQRRSHPKSEMPHHRTDIQNLESLFNLCVKSNNALSSLKLVFL